MTALPLPHPLDLECFVWINPQWKQIGHLLQDIALLRHTHPKSTALLASHIRSFSIATDTTWDERYLAGCFGTTPFTTAYVHINLDEQPPLKILQRFIYPDYVSNNKIHTWLKG